MVFLDYLVLFVYFAAMIGIGVWTSRKIHKQEDYFLGNRSFGKLLQTFAAFGAGTGSSDPVNTGRTTFTSGLSGMWSVMYWLFVTPFYWITGVWYRRMRHLTLGDWFVERYESKALGAGYCIFGLSFFMVYGSMMFSAIGKVAAPLVGVEAIVLGGQTIPIEIILVPVIGLVVLIYGVAGGLEAAYYTDLVQGLCIILLSLILVPFGLQALIEKFGDPATQSLWHGFVIMHERLPAEYFSVVGSTSTSEFPWYRILAVVLINLVGIVIQPHFIATGGGSAKTEMNARVGLVTGNFLKRFCTIGWVLTGLIALALFADNPALLHDPDKTWGIASRELLGPGLVGLMLACLLAALMSSADAYMVVGSALVVRNLYAAYVDAGASEKTYIMLGRLTGAIVIAGAVILSLFMMDVFEQLQLTWVFGILFAAPFWIGMYWRRATTSAAWITVAFCVLAFFLIPFLAPNLYPALRSDPAYLTTNPLVRTTTVRKAAPTDVARRQEQIVQWQNKRRQIENSAATAERQAALSALGPQPGPLQVGDRLEEHTITGGQSIFWEGGVKPVDAEGNPTKIKPQPRGDVQRIDANTTQVTLGYADDVRLRGFGNFRPDFLLYPWLGVPLAQLSDAMLATLELPPKIILPFLVMILCSLVTPRNSKPALDRYYAKMKTPVDPDPLIDRENLDKAYANPEMLEQKKLWPGSNLEFQKPNRTDILGFIVCFVLCFAIIGLAVWVANLGGKSG